MFKYFYFSRYFLSQILNGSFEIDNQPTLENWRFTCDELASASNDAPPLPDNNWSLKLESGNSQGCFPSYAYQIIPNIGDGEIWKASVYTKRENSLTQPKLYWKIFRANGEETDLSMATSSSEDWEQISVEDTIHISEGDSVAIVLDAGTVISVPEINNVFFDLVEVENLGETYNSPDEISSVTSDNSELFQNYPNPFNPITTISYSIPIESDVEISIYNLKGQKIKTFINENLKSGNYSLVWNGKNDKGKPVSSGFYFYKLVVNGKTKAIKKCVMLK